MLYNCDEAPHLRTIKHAAALPRARAGEEREDRRDEEGKEERRKKKRS